MNRLLKIGIILAAVALVAGCSKRQSLLDDTTEAVRKGDADPLVAKGDAHWENRGEEKEATAAIASWEAAAEMDPTRADVQLKLAYAYYFMANAHLKWLDDEDAADDAQKAAYDKGVYAGERAIKLLSPEFAAMIREGKDWEEAIPTVGAEGLPAMYWYATNLGKWGLLDGFTTILRLKDRVEAIMAHCLKLDETFFYGAPHRYFGVYRTKIPFPGGDMEASKRHFDKAVEIAPGYLDTKVLYAEAYAVKDGDEDLFRRLLNEVVNSADDVLPGLVPETRNAKRTAQKLLDEMEDHF